MITVWDILTGILVVSIFSRIATSKNTYSVFCKKYLDFCYFTDRELVTPTDIDDLDAICKKVNNKSRLIDLKPARKTLFENYIKTFDLTNVVLGAKRFQKKWQWIIDDSDVVLMRNVMVRDELLIYQTDPKNPQSYTTVCFVDCFYFYKKLDNKGIEEYGDNMVNTTGDRDHCNRECEKHPVCMGYEIEVKYPRVCRILMTNDIAIITKKGYTYYEKNGTSRTPEHCIGNYNFETSRGPTTSQKSTQTTKQITTKTTPKITIKTTTKTGATTRSVSMHTSILSTISGAKLTPKTSTGHTPIVKTQPVTKITLATSTIKVTAATQKTDSTKIIDIGKNTTNVIVSSSSATAKASGTERLTKPPVTDVEAGTTENEVTRTNEAGTTENEVTRTTENEAIDSTNTGGSQDTNSFWQTETERKVTSTVHPAKGTAEGETPTLTYLVAGFVATIVIMCFYGIFRRMRADEISESEEEVQ